MINYLWLNRSSSGKDPPITDIRKRDLETGVAFTIQRTLAMRRRSAAPGSQPPFQRVKMVRGVLRALRGARLLLGGLARSSLAGGSPGVCGSSNAAVSMDMTNTQRRLVIDGRTGDASGLVCMIDAPVPTQP
jgi:hypothetical protein